MKPLIVANWKMNPLTIKEARGIFNAVKRGVKGAGDAEVVICPPFVYLSSLGFGATGLKLGGQDVFYEEKGAFTGEISPAMLKNLGAEYVILGHSERRKYQEETNRVIEKKLRAAMTAGLRPILCIDKISQLPGGIQKGFTVAYEPLFAIGTGKPCSPEMAEKMRISIKKTVNLPVLYGGSVNSQNAQDYLMGAYFDGLLIGGASLKPQEFVDIVKLAC